MRMNSRAGVGFLASVLFFIAGQIAFAAPGEHLGKTVTVRQGNGSIRSFKVERHLGSGYWSHSYEGHDTATGEKVAIKLMKSEHGAAADSYDKETGILSKLSTPTISKAHGVGTTGDGRRAMVMEFAEGATLGAPYAVWSPRPPGKSVRIAMQILRGVRALEQADVRHNDIHPGNILMQNETSASVKIIDVGNATPTREGSNGGNPFYNAPTHGAANDDVYSAGAVLIHLMTGKASRDATNLAQIANPGLRAVAEKATHPDPAQRYRNAQELIEALRPYSAEN